MGKNDLPTTAERSPLLGPKAQRGEAAQHTGSGVPDPSSPSADIEAQATYGTVNGHDEEQNTSDSNSKPTIAEGPTSETAALIRSRFPYILPAVAIGVFLSAADQTIIVSSYGAIGSDLHSLNLTSWIATAYFLTLTSFQPLYGKLSDIFGRKSCLLFGYLVFGLGCLWCGLARDMKELIAARAFAGIGGGGMTTVVSILLSDVIPLRERGTWQGYINIIFASGASAGAPLGGLMADSIGWRAAFLFQAPLCLVAFLAVAFALPNTSMSKEGERWRTKLQRIDFLGALVLVCAVGTLLLALDRGSNVSWSSTMTLVSLGVSVVLFAAFVAIEVKVATEPFAPGHIIFHRSLFACYLCNFFSLSGLMAMLFYVPLYFQAVEEFNATQAGLRLIPSMVSSVSGSLFGGIWMQKYGRYYYLTCVSYIFLCVGGTVILLCSGVLVNSTVGIVLGMCISGFSNGIGVTSTLIGLIANASQDDQAIATACSYLFRSLGSVFGVSMSATIANQVLRSSLEESLRSDGPERAAEITKRVRESLTYLKQLEPELRALVQECYAVSIRAAFGLQIGLVAGAAVAAWFIREKALTR